jgi:hypothetical protein
LAPSYRSSLSHFFVVPLTRTCSYRFFELTPDGVPRFPVYVGVRLDMTAPTDATMRQVSLPAAAADA